MSLPLFVTFAAFLSTFTCIHFMSKLFSSDKFLVGIVSYDPHTIKKRLITNDSVDL